MVHFSELQAKEKRLSVKKISELIAMVSIYKWGTEAQRG